MRLLLGGGATKAPGRYVLDKGLQRVGRRGGEQRLQLTLLRDRATFEHRRAVTQRERLERIVGDDDEGQRRGCTDPANLRVETGFDAQVEGGKRFVQQQEARPGGERTGQRDALLLTAGE